MIVKIGFDIQFELTAPTPMILMLYVHPSRQADLRSEEKIVVEPDIPLTKAWIPPFSGVPGIVANFRLSRRIGCTFGGRPRRGG